MKAQSTNYKLPARVKPACRSGRTSAGRQTPNSKNQRGITLLMVLLLTSSILSISIGIFNLTIGELLVSGEIADSFVAFYAADEGIEKTLFYDRVLGQVCINPVNGQPVYGNDCYLDNQILSNGSGFAVRVTRNVSQLVEITSIGQYQCPGTAGPGTCGSTTLRIVKRGFLVTYTD